MRSLVFIMSLLLFASSSAVQAKMYKWVDENGQVHFGDKVPVQYMEKAHDELNNRGLMVKHHQAAKTEAERAEEKRLAQEQKQKELEEKRRKQRDRVLLDTYTTERDLVVARDARLDAVDSQIQLAENIISDSNKKIESLENQVLQIKASNREVPADVYQRIDSEKQQVKVQSRLKKEHDKRRAEISQQFEGYIARFKVLKAEQKTKREQLAKERGL